MREAAQSLLSFVTHSVIPDSTADSLQIDNALGGDPTVVMTQLGGGFTRSEGAPLYLEGYLGFATYDPEFVVGGVESDGRVKAKWQTLSATGGIGYDFPLADESVIRPVVNVSLSHMSSDAEPLGPLALGELSQAGVEAGDWLQSGWLTAAGLGGALIVDFERHRPAYEADLELRYTRY